MNLDISLKEAVKVNVQSASPMSVQVSIYTHKDYRIKN